MAWHGKPGRIVVTWSRHSLYQWPQTFWDRCASVILTLVLPAPRGAIKGLTLSQNGRQQDWRVDQVGQLCHLRRLPVRICQNFGDWFFFFSSFSSFSSSSSSLSLSAAFFEDNFTLFAPIQTVGSHKRKFELESILISQYRKTQLRARLKRSRFMSRSLPSTLSEITPA